MALDFVTETVGYELRDGIATITLNRPHEGNAITDELRRGVVAAWDEIKRDDAVRVAIITGAGERHFCTGASVSDLQVGEGSLLIDGPLRDCVKISAHQNDVWKPVICVVNGLVNAGGLHFVVDADIIIAARTAAFMDTHTSVGQVGAIENIGLARRMTLGGALLLTLAGRSHRMTAERAHQLGLVDLLESTPSEALATARTLAEGIALNSPQAMRLSKQAIWGSMEQGYQSAMERGWDLVKAQWSHPDFIEGPAAFAGQRAARWIAASERSPAD